MKKLSKYYSETKYVFEDGHHIRIADKNNYLFSQGQYHTKILAYDLPSYYVKGVYYGYNVGYMSAAEIKDLLYVPNKYSNHMFKDDFLYISYSDKIVKSSDITSPPAYISEEYVWGWNIVKMLKAAELFSNYDISSIKKQIEDKRKWFKTNYPDDYTNLVGDIDFFA